MSLENKLINEGSLFTLTAGNGTPAPYTTVTNFAPNGVSTNALATKFSPLHALYSDTSPSPPGYSINGNYAFATQGFYNLYKDGVINALPNPSTLDFWNGVEPPKYEDGPLAGALGFN
jgi:hypothetical protein